MKVRVRLSFSIEMAVEGKSEDAIINWLNNTTPEEALELVSNHSLVDTDYTEEIICPIRDDSEVSYVIR